ncbi:MAG: tol-pal system protein YbgF [Methylophaga sp.]|nr:tol-pal system protein YbgF [Methylophaga sp.]
MMKMAKKSLIVAMMLSPLMANTVWADEAALTQRIDRLERIIQGQGLVSLLGRVDQLQNEIQRLNGENESLSHELEMMKKRQRDLYLDIDQRLQAQSVIAPIPTVIPEMNTVQETTAVESSDITATVPEVAEVQVENATNAETVVVPEATPVAVENGEAAYQSALQTLRSGQYEQAITALSAFPEQYPQSSYLPNAYYWQGEANYVLRHFDLAIAAFQTVLDRFPESSKVADATLKKGFSQYELEQLELATATLTGVIEQYPNTSAARLAKVRLDRIKQATR